MTKDILFPAVVSTGDRKGRREGLRFPKLPGPDYAVRGLPRSPASARAANHLPNRLAKFVSFEPSTLVPPGTTTTFQRAKKTPGTQRYQIFSITAHTLPPLRSAGPRRNSPGSWTIVMQFCPCQGQEAREHFAGVSFGLQRQWDIGLGAVENTRECRSRQTAETMVARAEK